LHDFVLCFGRYANPALDTVDAGRSSINQSGPLRVLIVEILMRLGGGFAMSIWAILNSLGLGGGPSWTMGDLGSLAMFQIPAYDPIAIVMMGFGVVLAAGLAFVLWSPFDFRDPPWRSRVDLASSKVRNKSIASFQACTRHVRFSNSAV
jgi:hypothetical protein